MVGGRIGDSEPLGEPSRWDVRYMFAAGFVNTVFLLLPPIVRETDVSAVAHFGNWMVQCARCVLLRARFPALTVPAIITTPWP